MDNKNLDASAEFEKGLKELDPIDRAIIEEEIQKED